MTKAATIQWLTRTPMPHTGRGGEDEEMPTVISGNLARKLAASQTNI